LFLQQVANGLILGSAFALVGVGFTLVFGVAKIVNFAHPTVVTVGAYAGYVSFKYLPGGLATAILLSLLAAGTCGVLLEYSVFRPLRGRSYLAPLVGSIGAGLVLQNAIALIFGTSSLPFTETVTNSRPITLGPVQVEAVQLSMIGVALIIMVLLWGMIHHTPLGRDVRAVAESHDNSQLLGIDVHRTIMTVLIIGSALAGVAGITIGAAFSTISPDIGFEVGLIGLVGSIVGGIGSVFGTVVAGLLIGVAESLTVGYLSSNYAEVVAFGLVIAVLLVRPSGIFRRGLGAVRY
jgi:branched-chain amino acid transport system permease protein